MDDDVVTSEVNNFSLRRAGEKCRRGYVVSSFPFSPPLGLFERTDKKKTDRCVMEEDHDGDLDVPRRRACDADDDRCLLIEHLTSTTVSGCGRQVWRGSLLAADYLMCCASRSSTGLGNVLELGAGAGVASVASALLCGVAKTVATDLEEVVGLAGDNFRRNSISLFGDKSDAAKLETESFDLTRPTPTSVLAHAPFDLVLAAHLAYDDALSEAVASRARELADVGAAVGDLVFCLEKRYNFTLREMDVVASGYEHFLRSLRRAFDLEEEEGEAGAHGARITELSCDRVEQYFCYERSKDLCVVKLELGRKGKK